MNDVDCDTLNSSSIKRKNPSNSSDDEESGLSKRSHLESDEESLTLEECLNHASNILKAAKESTDDNEKTELFERAIEIWKFAFAPERNWSPSVHDYKTVLNAIEDAICDEDNLNLVQDFGYQLASKANAISGEFYGYSLVFFTLGRVNNIEELMITIDDLENLCRIALQSVHAQHITLYQYERAIDEIEVWAVSQEILWRERCSRVEADLYYSLSQNIGRLAPDSRAIVYINNGMWPHLRLVLLTKDTNVKEKYIHRTQHLADKIINDDCGNEELLANAIQVYFELGKAVSDLSRQRYYFTRAARLFNEQIVRPVNKELFYNPHGNELYRMQIDANEKAANCTGDYTAKLYYIEQAIRYYDEFPRDALRNTDYHRIAQMSEQAIGLSFTPTERRRHISRTLFWAVKLAFTEADSAYKAEGLRKFINVIITSL